jgi:DNA polymerase V
VFLQTNRFDISRPAYANSLTLPLESPSQDTALLIRRALQALSRIHRPNYTYHKAGVLMLDLVPSDQQQSALFGPSSDERERCGRRMEAIDRINRTFGQQTIHIGSEALSNHWKMRAQLKSPAYTTRWDELPLV